MPSQSNEKTRDETRNVESEDNVPRIEITPEQHDFLSLVKEEEVQCNATDRQITTEEADSKKEHQELVDRYLPEAQTCFFSLSLPDYSSCEIMREKLLQAITSCKAIDTDFVVRDTPIRSPLTSSSISLTSETERRRRRQLLRSRTHNSSDHSQAEAAVAFSEEGLSQADSGASANLPDASNLLLQLERSYESFSQSWM